MDQVLAVAPFFRDFYQSAVFSILYDDFWNKVTKNAEALVLPPRQNDHYFHDSYLEK